jgi:RNA polymerase sigma factor (sigma-70 family)
MWVNRITTYEDTPEEGFMRQIEGYVVSISNKYWIEGFEADDIAQELRLHIWKKMDNYDPNRGTIDSWAYKVLQNRARDLYKRTDPLCNEHEPLEEIDTECDIDGNRII